MRIGCMMPVYNRFPDHGHLVNEAVESFLRQDYTDAVLLVCNDTPGQHLHCPYPGVEVVNMPQRYPDFGTKLQAMVELLTVQGCDALCRWDDDDISLPWRLAESATHLGDVTAGGQLAAHLGGVAAWRPGCHWYAPAGHSWDFILHPGNTHIAAIWRPGVLQKFPDGKYPQHCLGAEDQKFNHYLDQYGVNHYETVLSPALCFYIYRWGVQPYHLSGMGADMAVQWQRIGDQPILPGDFEIQPKWAEDYTQISEMYAVKTQARPCGQG